MAGELRIFMAYMRLHVRSWLAYRAAFLSQCVFMFLNNVIWIVIWQVMFGVVETVNGYRLEDALLLFGIGAFGIGVARLVFGRIGDIYELAQEGRLDIYMSQPLDALFHIAIGRARADAVGDVVFGLLLFLWIAPAHVALAIAVSVVGMVVYLAFSILVQSIVFWLDRPKNTIQALNNIFITFTLWPIDTYKDPARTILYIIPFAFVATVPKRLVTSFGWELLGLLLLVAVISLVVSVVVFRIGLRRYAGGNQIAMHG